MAVNIFFLHRSCTHFITLTRTQCKQRKREKQRRTSSSNFGSTFKDNEKIEMQTNVQTTPSTF